LSPGPSKDGALSPGTWGQAISGLRHMQPACEEFDRAKIRKE